jgi:hypothetical protein
VRGKLFLDTVLNWQVKSMVVLEDKTVAVDIVVDM